MRYVFFGTPRFAAILLKELIKGGMPPVAVVCNPDKPYGRKKILTPPPAKLVALAHDIPVFQPEKPTALIEKLKGLRADVFVVAAYAHIIPKDVFDLPPQSTIGVHPSLLPYYRGASPIQSVLLAGERMTGVTLYRIDEAVDHGPIYSQKPCEILPEDMYLELEERLAYKSAELLSETLPKIASGTVVPKEQQHEHATFTNKFTIEDGFVEGNDIESAQSGNQEKATIISRKIKALNPEPGVWTMEHDTRVKLLEATIKDGKLLLRKIQKAGKTPEHVSFK